MCSRLLLLLFLYSHILNPKYAEMLPCSAPFLSIKSHLCTCYSAVFTWNMYVKKKEIGTWLNEYSSVACSYEPTMLDELHKQKINKKSISVVQMGAMLICSTHYITSLLKYSNPSIDSSLSPVSKAYHQKNCPTPHPSHSCATKPWFIRERFVWLYWVLKGALHPHRLLWNLLFEKKTESRLCRKHGREKRVTVSPTLSQYVYQMLFD